MRQGVGGDTLKGAAGAPIAGDVARRVRLVSLDVDGVLTDGTIWFAGAGGSKRVSGAGSTDVFEAGGFHVHDGLGIRLLIAAGLEVAFVSGRRSRAVESRAHELGVAEVHLGVPAGKLTAVEGLLSRRGWTWRNVAHLGDDLTDLPVLERAGLPAAVANAVPEVLASSTWHGTVPGGRGAVREFARALLAARGAWNETVDGYLATGRADGAPGGRGD